MQREFINIASHEMKTPTQAILGYSDLVQKHPEKREEMLNAISRNAIRLQKLTNDILDVTRIESQTLNLNKEQFNLNDLILDIVEDYKNEIEKDNKDNVKLLYNHQPKNHDFLSTSEVLVEADRGRIAQVISNLLSNAIKFTSKSGGVVSVSTEIKYNDDVVDNNNNQEVMVSIKDNGEGIHPEVLPRLFTKFASKSFTGTGLGLFISKSIIEAHGGKMWAKNNSDDLHNGEKGGGMGGATFAFTLPLESRGDSLNSEWKEVLKDR
jgi:two-component system, OmpR family, sensor histidine kinase VicK